MNPKPILTCNGATNLLIGCWKLVLDILKQKALHNVSFVNPDLSGSQELAVWECRENCVLFESAKKTMYCLGVLRALWTIWKCYQHCVLFEGATSIVLCAAHQCFKHLGNADSFAAKDAHQDSICWCTHRCQLWNGWLEHVTEVMRKLQRAVSLGLIYCMKSWLVDWTDHWLGAATNSWLIRWFVLICVLVELLCYELFVVGSSVLG